MPFYQGGINDADDDILLKWSTTGTQCKALGFFGGLFLFFVRMMTPTKRFWLATILRVVSRVPSATNKLHSHKDLILHGQDTEGKYSEGEISTKTMYLMEMHLLVLLHQKNAVMWVCLLESRNL